MPYANWLIQEKNKQTNKTETNIKRRLPNGLFALKTFVTLYRTRASFIVSIIQKQNKATTERDRKWPYAMETSGKPSRTWTVVVFDLAFCLRE